MRASQRLEAAKPKPGALVLDGQTAKTQTGGQGRQQFGLGAAVIWTELQQCHQFVCGMRIDMRGIRSIECLPIFGQRIKNEHVIAFSYPSKAIVYCAIVETFFRCSSA